MNHERYMPQHTATSKDSITRIYAYILISKRVHSDSEAYIIYVALGFALLIYATPVDVKIFEKALNEQESTILDGMGICEICSRVADLKDGICQKTQDLEKLITDVSEYARKLGMYGATNRLTYTALLIKKLKERGFILHCEILKESSAVLWDRFKDFRGYERQKSRPGPPKISRERTLNRCRNFILLLSQEIENLKEETQKSNIGVKMSKTLASKKGQLIKKKKVLAKMILMKNDLESMDDKQFPGIYKMARKYSTNLNPMHKQSGEQFWVTDGGQDVKEERRQS